jgi:DNA-binding protein WhiA
MSFSSEQKQEIISHQYKSSCCRRALLSGYIFARGEILGGNTIRIKAEKESTMEFISRLVKEFYGKELVPTRSRSGGRYIYSEFDSNSATKYIQNIQKGDLFFGKCQTCESSFLRGVFLGAGRITDPDKQYCLEFYLGDRTEIFAEYLTDLGVPPSISLKKTGKVLYYKNSSKIEDFSALSAMNKTVFAIMNAKISGEIRNSVNRIANCETNNIGKAVRASGKHLEVITELAKANLLSSLPDELERTARLRMEFPDYSLTQLSQIIVPPVSKSGLSHRLNKIVELSKSLLNKI